ncbi:MAG: vanadium-dependent haloperoxidase [Pseudomonadota bacterium]
MKWLVLLLLGAPALVTASVNAAPSADPAGPVDPARPVDPTVAAVLDWNRTVLALAEAEDGFMTLKGVRTAAIMHLAMRRVLEEGRGDAVAMAPAYIAAAAHAVALRQFPGQQATLDALLQQHQPAADERVLARGRAVAQAVLAQRADDGWDREAEYRWHPMGPGVYAEFAEHSGTPEGFVFGAGWAQARGFALERPDQFRVPAPPAIDSPAYARAFEEVKSLGRFQTLTRTPDQSHIALWWKDFVENSHNRLARSLIRAEALSPDVAVSLLALLNSAIFDAYVSSFENKFHYNHWRPYTAIRWAHEDGNAATQREASWTNLHRHSYAFPSYPSAHGTACGAAMTVLEAFLGTPYAFTMTTAEVDIAGPFSGKIALRPPTRTFASFADAAHECGRSRVYLGIHFDYDATAGVALGRQVGERALNVLGGPAQR